MNTTCKSNINAKIILCVFFCILGILLQGCKNSGNGDVQPQPNISTPTVVHTPIATTTSIGELTNPFSFNLEEVNCQFELENTQDFTHWSDSLIPGISTIDDLLKVKKLSYLNEPQRVGFWSYRSGNIRLQFKDGLLHDKTDARIELSDIVGHYGLPQEIVWEVPQKPFHGAIYATHLIYPEDKAVFFTWEKITEFTLNTKFEYS